MYRSVQSFDVSLDLPELAVAPGTPITALMAPRSGQLPMWEHLLYMGGAAHDHTITLMKSGARQTLAAGNSAGDVSLTLSGSLSSDLSGVLDEDDWVVVQLSDGSYFRALVSSFSSPTLTLATGYALPAAAQSGASVFHMGAPADHAATPSLGRNPQRQGLRFRARAGVVTERENSAVGLCVGEQSTPLLFHSDNAGTAGTLLFLGGAWVTAAG